MMPSPQSAFAVTPSTLTALPTEPGVASLLPAAPVRQTNATVIAQQFDQDILGDLGNMVRTFIDSGQVWALLIGIVIGYMIRSITTYR